jgi:hypothetical protein
VKEERKRIRKIEKHGRCKEERGGLSGVKKGMSEVQETEEETVRK